MLSEPSFCIKNGSGDVMRNLKEEFSRAGQPLLDAFHGGRALVAHNHLGAHFSREDGTDGVRFTVYAPYAVRIAVIGDFNAWNENAHILHKIDNLGVFSVFVPGACRGFMAGSWETPPRGGILYSWGIRVFRIYSCWIHQRFRRFPCTSQGYA